MWRRWPLLTLPILGACTTSVAPAPRPPVLPTPSVAKRPDPEQERLKADMAAKFRREEILQRREEEKVRRAIQLERDAAEAREALARLRADAGGYGSRSRR